ncbi:unnamed protein product [Phytophthora fragariaefolia]|uniref:Unnamed protein product n=1 Tax=Phytophthora fragariaefolia TaxID=1490495 RepID=A0A9W6TKN7_9STRA|nr:unnamed protein product [Phytophthora fragariaefolia]
MANDNVAFQAPTFVRMDPPQDEDDEEAKESDPPVPDSFLDLSRGASTTKLRSKSSQLGKRASGSQSPKSNKKQAPDGVQELPSEWVAPDGRQVGVPTALAGEDKCLHSSSPLADLTIMLLSMMHWHRLDSAPWTKYVHRRYLTAASVALEGLRRTGTHIPEWRVIPGPSLDDGEIDLLESEDKAEDKAEKDEDYNHHQAQDDGVDDEDEISDDASDDGVLNVAQRTTQRRRLRQSPQEYPFPEGQYQVASQDECQGRVVRQVQVRVRIVEEAEAEVRRFQTPKRKHRYCSCGQGPQHLDAEECRVIESPGLGITSWMYFGVRMKPGDPTAHASFQTQGFPNFVPNRHDLDILKERCDGEELKAFVATRPWTKLSDTRRTEFFFHHRADLGDWVDFMEKNVEVLWHATQWIVLDRDSTSKFIRKTSVRHLNLHKSVRKKVIAREKQLKKVAPA